MPKFRLRRQGGGQHTRAELERLYHIYQRAQEPRTKGYEENKAVQQKIREIPTWITQPETNPNGCGNTQRPILLTGKEIYGLSRVRLKILPLYYKLQPLQFYWWLPEGSGAQHLHNFSGQLIKRRRLGHRTTKSTELKTTSTYTTHIVYN